jgi:phosphoribosylglycinamide formyltransferase-1
MENRTNNKSKARVAVLISGGGTNLQAIIDRWQEGKLPHVDPVLVVSSKRGAGGLERAHKAGIKRAFISKAGRVEMDEPGFESGGECEAPYDAGQSFEESLINLLESERVDVIVLAGFLKILSEDFVRRYPDRIINVHPSLIPSFCGDGFYGLKVHEAALGYGVKVTGATVHFVNEVTDGGRIIAQKAVEVMEGDTPEVLQRRVMEQAEWILLPEAVEKVSAGIVNNY